MSKTFLSLPHGLEVLIIKASVDPEFRALLLDRRAGAAAEISLTLTPTESAMLAAIPAATLETTIAQTQVLPETRRVFLGQVAAAMLAALGVGTTGCNIHQPDEKDVQRNDQGMEISPDAPPQSGITHQEFHADGLTEAQRKALMEQSRLDNQELSERRRPMTKGIQPYPKRPPVLEENAVPPVADVPQARNSQPTTVTTETEMIDLRTLVKFPKPSFGHTASDVHIPDVLRDGWDVSPNSKRKDSGSR